jgi:monoamine oxidase
LSSEKSLAIGAVDYYSATKFYLRPTAKFWEADGYEPTMWTDGPIERVFAQLDENNEVYSLLVWINGQGSRRIDQFDRETAARIVLEEMARLRPASKGNIEVMGHHAWGRTPFIGGCGHSFSAGQISRFAQELSKPEGRIHFAGEHTRRMEFGMESAMASAERVAAEIVATA